MAQSFLNEYEILHATIAHEGAFATVYKVRHKQLGYIRAIRVLREAIVDEHDEKYQKFLAECQLLLRLGNGGHPNIVRIAQPRLLQGHALVEMEYVNGKDLNDYIAEKNQFIPIHEVLRFVHEISSALAYCHEGIYEFCMDREHDNLRDDPEDGSKVLLDASTKKRLVDKYKVIHNDIHSKNIIRKYDGSFILLDFGLSIQNGTVVKSSTRKGGAAEYKAPEKWRNEGLISEQTDMYSFGILMYEMLAGQVPFPYVEKTVSAKAEYELMQQHETKEPAPIEPLRRTAFERAHPNKKYEKDYPDWLEPVIMKCLEKKSIDRYKNGQVLFEEVEKHLAEANEHANNEAVKKLQTENNQLAHKITQLQQRNKDLETQKVDADKKIKQLEKEKTEIEKERANLQKQTEDAENQHKMGDNYYYEKNYVEAVKWYKKGAIQGNSSDQTNLGWMYRNGYGVVKNYIEAAKWYRKAAEQGNASAQSWLGFMYENGYGVTKDKIKAIEWYKKAAEQGNQTAISNLKNLEIDN
ncbi:MAG: protein kinase [Candidatus Symbiothrix sp.]|jgi:serine/threonine protein kinase|nr:protein kinase [Candidatus Symbiothrix sp.]